MRFSIVLELDETWKDTILAVQSRFSGQYPTVQWLERDQLFLTVKFLGSPLKRYHRDLKKVLAQVTAGIAPFNIELTRAGCFPSDGPERVVWLGISETSGMLDRFARDCNRAFQKFGVDETEGDFIPHVVLGRVQLANSKGKLRKSVETTVVPPLSKKMEETCLVLSRMDKKEGTSYEIISRAAFGATVLS